MSPEQSRAVNWFLGGMGVVEEEEVGIVRVGVFLRESRSSKRVFALLLSLLLFSLSLLFHPPLCSSLSLDLYRLSPGDL